MRVGSGHPDPARDLPGPPDRRAPRAVNNAKSASARRPHADEIARQYLFAEVT
jgi:hypothetical protein